MLLDLLKSLAAAERQALADACGTSVDYLFQIAYGNRRPKVELAVAIERETVKLGRKVPCEVLLPAVDWEYLRGQPRAAEAGCR